MSCNQFTPGNVRDLSACVLCGVKLDDHYMSQSPAALGVVEGTTCGVLPWAESKAPLPMMQLAEGFGDPETLFNSRDWLRKAIEGAGAKVSGGGVGMGQCDLDFTLEGCKFNVSLHPIFKNPNPVAHDRLTEGSGASPAPIRSGPSGATKLGPE